MFQFTRPRGARRARATRLRRRTSFQFTRPRGARLKGIVDLCTWFKFQFTRPRGARPVKLGSVREIEGVSIHAPTGGATFGFVREAVK